MDADPTTKTGTSRERPRTRRRPARPGTAAEALPAATIEVRVFDTKRHPIKARVRLRASGPQASPAIDLPFEKRVGAYTALALQPGTYRIEAAAHGMEAEHRRITIDSELVRERFILGPPGLPFYFRGNTRIPFDSAPLRDLIAVGLRTGRTGQEEQDLVAKAGQLGLSPETVGAAIQKDNVRVFRFAHDASDSARKDAAQALDQDPAAKYAGAIVRLDGKSVSFLTREILVRFRPGVTADRIQALAHALGLDSGRPLPWSPRTFLFEKPGAVGYELLDTLQEIDGSGLAIHAEPNLVVTAVNLAAVTPTDYLWGQQAYLRTGGTGIGVDTAWGILRDRDPAKLFGSSDIVIAVMDEGVASTAVTAQAPARARHPDLDGNVSSGDYKVSQFFDFNTLQADNSTPGLDAHGVRCAGVATALANNPVADPTLKEMEGMAGIAPNCRLMALRRPSPGKDTEYYQAYLWTAGLDPGPGWMGPAPPMKGADIISNSFLRFEDDSSLMESLYATLTQQGRGGKGCVILFSAGNDDGDISSVNPSVLHSTLIVVSATNTDDTWHAPSNYGAGVSICAPQGLVTCDATGGRGGDIRGNSNGELIYYPYFTDTSASTALAAGVAALVLSACPDLTWDEVKKILEDSANPIDQAGGAYYDTDGDQIPDYSNKYGCGRIDAAVAVQKAISQNDTTPPGTVTDLTTTDA